MPGLSTGRVGALCCRVVDAVEGFLDDALAIPAAAQQSTDPKAGARRVDVPCPFFR